MGVLPSTKINLKNLKEDINGRSTYNVKIRVSNINQRYDTYMERERKLGGEGSSGGKIQDFYLI